MDVISGDELDVIKTVPGENHGGRAGESTAQSEILPGGRSEGQSSRTLGQQESGDSNVSVNITPSNATGRRKQDGWKLRRRYRVRQEFDVCKRYSGVKDGTVPNNK